MAARGPEFTTIETVEHDLRLARELGLRITIHIGLGANGPKYRGVERMHQHKLLGPDVTFVHCCNCSDHEFHLMAETGTTASVSAQIASTCGGFGLPATGKLLAHGVRPGTERRQRNVGERRSVLGDARRAQHGAHADAERSAGAAAAGLDHRAGRARLRHHRRRADRRPRRQDRQHRAGKIRRPHPDPAPCAQSGADGRSGRRAGARRPRRQCRSRDRRGPAR